MEFSKEQIVSKNFSKQWMGGYSESEVRDFLHVLAEQIRHLKQENLLLKKDVQDKESLIKDYRDREHILKESISNAESWAQRIKQDAESQRQLLLEKAQGDSEHLIESARHSLQSVYSDIADLKRLQLQFKTGLKAALQVQMDLLEEDSLFNPNLLTDAHTKNQFLDSNNDTQSDQKASSSIPHQDLSSNITSEKEKTPCSKEETSLKNSPTSDKKQEENSDHTEINSLRETLSSLNKNFS